MSEAELALRPEKSSDLPFLRKLFDTTRIDVTFSSLPQEQKEQFLAMQFSAQHHSYHTSYENTRFLIIEHNGRPIGRIYVSRMQNEMRVIDISILPKYRKQGIGSQLLRMVQDEGRALALPVTLHAEKLGKMNEYYEKLGFEIVEEKEAHFFMKWTASSSVIAN